MSSIAKKLYRKAVNAYINKVDPEHKKSRLLYEGELHVPLHNFTGPGTRLDILEVRNMKPYNDIDACSKKHDLDYEKIKNSNMDKESKAEAIQKADQEAIDCYDKHKDQYGYSLAKAGISGKLGVEKLLSTLKGKASVLYGGFASSVSGGLINTFTDEQLFMNRNPKYYTDREKETLDLVTVKSDDTDIEPVGSFTFSIQKYPSDIDVNEFISVTTIEDFLKNFRDTISKIALSYRKGYYFSDFKCGKIEDEALHWSMEEIFRGYKKVTIGHKTKSINIIDALKQESIVKLDIISVDYNRIMEASAFFVIYVNDEATNISDKFFEEYIDNIRKDVQKYKDIKPFKSVKRLWSLSRIEKNTKVLRDLSGLINSNISLLGQISADLETMYILFEKYMDDIKIIDVNKKKLVLIVDSLIKKLSNIDDITKITSAFDLYAEEMEKVKEYIKISQYGSTMKHLEELHMEMEKIIKKETDDYLREIKFLL